MTNEFIYSPEKLRNKRIIMRFTLQVFLVCSLLFFSSLQASYLADFVAKPDPSYKWELVEEKNELNYSTYLLNMTSQTWRSENEVNKPEWTHWLKLIVPNELKHKTPFLFITGGYNGKPEAKTFEQEHVEWALETQSIFAVLTLVPNQTLIFKDETNHQYKEEGRREDGIIAYTWKKFLTTKDPSWPLQLPMTKSVVRAMDTIESFCKEEQNLELDGFVLAGMSKRGWVSWTAASIDPRVKGVVPMVIDLLNLNESFTHHYNAYGFWSPAIKDYLESGIVEHRDTQDFKELLTLVEPYENRQNLTMPKYIVNSTGDEFFVCDSSQFYFHELKAEKYLRYVPNTHHTLNSPDTWEAVKGFYLTLLNKERLPKFSWKLADENSILVRTQDVPVEVNLWQANNPAKRDFRYRVIGDAWKKQRLTANKKGEFKATIAFPDKGWTAFFIELKYANTCDKPLIFTTDVFVCPDILPYDTEQ